MQRALFSNRGWPWLVLLLWTATPFCATTATKDADGPSYLQLALDYEQGRRGLPRDPQEAFRLYCLAHAEGDPEAAYHLGWLHFTGRGVPRDMARAAWWFRKAAEKGDRTAANLLARLGEARAERDDRCDKHLAEIAPARLQLERWVHRLAPRYRLDPKLVIAVIEAESGFDPRARSSKGALGLMQLMPRTARRFGVKDPWDPLQNLHGGMAYLRWLLDRFDGNLSLVLAGYNAGEKAVEEYGGVPPFRETRRYVQRITRNLQQGKLLRPAPPLRSRG